MVDELLPSARELMTQDYLVMRPSLGLIEAVGLLEEHPEDTAFVIDDHDRFLGVLTEKECLRALSARAYDTAIAETVQDVMCEAPSLLAPETDAYAAVQAMLSCSCGMLPVMDHGKIIGAVSQIELLRALLRIFRHRTESLGEAEQTAADLRGRPESKEQMQRVASNLDRDQLASLFSQTRRQE